MMVQKSEEGEKKEKIPGRLYNGTGHLGNSMMPRVHFTLGRNMPIKPA